MNATNQNLTYDMIVIGGGPAGLSAAVSAREAGLSRILILERDNELGGILNQCIHNGFGLHTFREELTGPEYADRFIRRVKELAIPFLCNTMVLDIAGSDAVSEEGIPLKTVTAMNRQDGLFTLQAKTVILAMGCRERPRGALNIPGYRPAGIYTAGTAQRLVNMEGQMPGRDAVILGSGDIGLIMARRMTLEGAKVHAVAELMPYSGGLQRNIVQCLEDFDIPLKLSHTVVNIHGTHRVEAVTLAQVDENRCPIPGTEERIPCDTLLLSCGLLPENELSRQLGTEICPATGGPVVNESMETNIPGVFACGNVLHVHDLVDYVSEEAGRAGRQAAHYLSFFWKKDRHEPPVPIEVSGGIRYTVPQQIRLAEMEDTLLLRFRCSRVLENGWLCVYADDRRIVHRKAKKLIPAEMQQLILRKSDLEKQPLPQRLTVCFETEEERL